MSAPAAISSPSQASVLYIPLLVRDDYGGAGYQWLDAVTGGSNGNIYFKTLDVNTFVVEWYQVKRYDSDDRETFEIVLRRDGSIKLQYQSVSSADSATVGIENAAGTTAQQQVCNGDG